MQTDRHMDGQAVGEIDGQTDVKKVGRLRNYLSSNRSSFIQDLERGPHPPSSSPIPPLISPLPLPLLSL